MSCDVRAEMRVVTCPVMKRRMYAVRELSMEAREGGVMSDGSEERSKRRRATKLTILLFPSPHSRQERAQAS